MSDRRRFLVDEVNKLSRDDQDRFVDFMLKELEDRQEWSVKFAKTSHILEKLAMEARADYDAGRTRPIEELLGE